MKDYLIDTGAFNIIVRPHKRVLYLLLDDATSARALEDFISGNEVSYDSLRALWFKYARDEQWTDFDGKRSSLASEGMEELLIDQFVLKRFNFGGLVAERVDESRKVKIFKPGKLRNGLPTAAH